jgi:oligopeptide/dipeptide ABC transporter ATP-binding protein
VSALLEVRNLKTYFRSEGTVVRAVDGVSFTVERGRTLGLVGESGCGKSVTNLSILRLIPSPPGRIVEGEILLEGKDLARAPESEMRHIRGNRVSMIFQDPMTSLNPYLTAGRQVAEVLELHKGMSSAQARARAREMFELVGIPDPERRQDEYPHQLSGGMRQRVMIAMALACEPKVLLADEPTTALDVTIQAQILELIKDLRRRLGTAVVLVTHDLGVVAGMADDIAVMYAGRIVEYGPAREIFRNPKHPYTQGLLASKPRLDTQGALKPIRGMPPHLGALPEGCRFRPRCDYAHARCQQYPDQIRASAGHWAACWLLDEKPQEARA